MAYTTEARFDTYLRKLSPALVRPEQKAAFKAYCSGLILPGVRKSIEPMAARLDPGRVSAGHQSLHHFVANGEWSDEGMLAAVRAEVLSVIQRQQPLQAWIVDEICHPKKGRHSVGVARQPCGPRGRRDNCQVAITIWVANDHASLPIAYQMFLPEPWARDFDRRAKVGVPEHITFRTKPEIALEQLRAAQLADTPPAVVVADAGYGTDTAFRKELEYLGLPYIVGVHLSMRVWMHRHPRTIQEVVEVELWRAEDAHTVAWREGTNGPVSSQFLETFVRLDDKGIFAPRGWLRLLVEWPNGERRPTKYWLSNLSGDTPLSILVRLAKVRWRVEQDFLELIHEIGIGHYEGRGWRGFHHHGTLAIAAYGFLVAERLRRPKSGRRLGNFLTAPPVPTNYRPRGSPRNLSDE